MNMGGEGGEGDKMLGKSGRDKVLVIGYWVEVDGRNSVSKHVECSFHNICTISLHWNI